MRFAGEINKAMCCELCDAHISAINGEKAHVIDDPDGDESNYYIVCESCASRTDNSIG